jgi:hypothetical protein
LTAQQTTLAGQSQSTKLLHSWRRFGLTLVLLGATLCSGQTRVGGIISGDERWSAEKGPYLLSRDVLITPQGRLTITPGTQVVIAKPLYYDDAIPQLDALDSNTVSIKVQGSLRCMGRATKRIIFRPQGSPREQCSWYGIVMQNSATGGEEIGFTDISGACSGITIRQSTPLIRNTILENCNVGLRIEQGASPTVLNCVITTSLSAGVQIAASNATIMNSIIAFNHNTGIWCDGVSRIDFSHNCLYGNGDGDFLACDPVLGKLVQGKGKSGTTDARNNLYADPIFAGSIADSSAARKDSNRPTPLSEVYDTAIAAVVSKAAPSTTTPRPNASSPPGRFQLSRFSPCIDKGNPAKKYHDSDATPNDMGVFGGPELMAPGR